MSEYLIKSENTAISNGNSRSAELLKRDSTLNDICLDYGCGKLRNAAFLKPYVTRIDLFDSKVQLDKQLEKTKEYGDVYYLEDCNLPIDTYDKILCSFVINVIQGYDERKAAIVSIIKALKIGGLAYIEVRNKTFISDLKVYEEDIVNGGYIIGAGKTRTYQFPFNMDELVDFIISIDNNIKIIEKVKTSGSAICIFQKI